MSLTSFFTKRPEPTQPPEARLTAWVIGLVQGVGFRWWVRSEALELGLTGAATNYPDGRVLVVAQGDEAACQQLEEALKEQPSRRNRPGDVDTVVASIELNPQPRNYRGFEVREKY